MRRFFLENIEDNLSPGSELAVPDELIHRMMNVLRFGEGDRIELINGRGLILEAVISTKVKRTSFKVSSVRLAERSRPLLGLAVAIIRRERFDLLVEKAVELGVDVIIPFEAEHSRPFADGAFNKLRERWQRIADQALSQCERPFRCEIRDVARFSDLLKIKDLEEKVFFHFGSKRADASLLKKDRSHLFIIGPEGGFSDQEVALLDASGARCYSLTDNILRTETAAFYALSVANFLFDRE